MWYPRISSTRNSYNQYFISPSPLETGYDKNCDWWSYGALLYEMLVGAPPFYSENKKEMIRKIHNVDINY